MIPQWTHLGEQNTMNRDWYFLPLLLVIMVLVATGEMAIGLLIMGPLLILAYWLMENAFGAGKNGE
jgi:hypothetical protein